MRLGRAIVKRLTNVVYGELIILRDRIGIPARV